MPDEYGFDHLPWWGSTYHACSECDWPGWGVFVSETERARHHRGHVRARKKEQARTQKANLALARRAKRQHKREEA